MFCLLKFFIPKYVVIATTLDKSKMLNKISELALFSGKPKFNERLFVGRPNIGNRDHLLARINDMLDRKWLSNNGTFVQEFERQIADYLGVKHCIAVCNGFAKDCRSFLVP